MPFCALATEYYVSEITLNPGQQVKVYLPDMYVEAMNNYGGGYPYSWSSDNQNICTATGYKSRTFCNIYAKAVGDTKIHYHGEYYRNGVIYDYDCYWDIKVIAAGNNGDCNPACSRHQIYYRLDCGHQPCVLVVSLLSLRNCRAHLGRSGRLLCWPPELCPSVLRPSVV